MDRRRFLYASAGLAVSCAVPIEAEPLPQRVVVVGGGIIGASIALHLVRRGAQVTLLEKQRPACGATGKSFAWINATFSKQPRAYYELNLLGMHGWRRLEQELKGALRVRWGGCVEWYPEGEEAAQLSRDVPRHQGLGYATRLVDETEMRRLLPRVTLGPVAAASFSEQEGAVDPTHAVNILLKESQRLGARVVYPCEMTGMDIATGQVRGVRTSQGAFEADVVVLACGVDTPRVAAMAEVVVPMKDSPGVLAHMAPQPRLLERVALAPGAHLVQRFDGRMVTGSSFGGSPVTDSSNAYGEKLLREATRFLPPLASAKLERVTLGWRVMPQDEFPIIGFAGRCPNLYIAAMHSGITLSPLVGQLAAMEILDHASVDLLAPYRLSRFP